MPKVKTSRAAAKRFKTTGEYLKETKKEEIFFDKQKKDHYMNHMFHGYDMDRTMLRIGAMNMMTHGIDNPFIEYRA